MLLLIVATIAIVVWALVDIVQTNPAHVRRLPKWAWVILLFPLAPAGAIAWFFLGRPKETATVPASKPLPGLLPRRQRYVARPAPDDDAEFMSRLAQEAEHRKLFRRLEDDLDGE